MHTRHEVAYGAAPPNQGGDPPAIVAEGLTKTYGKSEKAVHALRGVDLRVPSGTVFALLGPNGAGKSTTVRILTTLSRADSGNAAVAGHDVWTASQQVRRSIGLVSQRPGFDPIATGTENLSYIGRVYGMSVRAAHARAAELLERFDLAGAADRPSGKWSGGMQRKLDVAMGLVHSPQVLFLDEPTTGLDPEARADMWSEIARLARDGTTVLMTTHYLEEADALADAIAIVDRGTVVADGTPDTLKSELRGETVVVEVADPARAGAAETVLRDVPDVAEITVEGAVVRSRVAAGAPALPGILNALEGNRIPLASVTVARPSLDDVYLRFAGRSYHANPQDAPVEQTAMGATE